MLVYFSIFIPLLFPFGRVSVIYLLAGPASTHCIILIQCSFVIMKLSLLFSQLNKSNKVFYIMIHM